MLIRNLVRQLVVLSALLISGTGGFAQQTNAAALASQQVNLASLYMMVSQRMAAATCLLIADVDVERRRNIADSSWQELDWFLEMLEFGDDSDEFPPQESAQVLDAIGLVNKDWAQVKIALRQIIAGDLHPVVVRQFIAGSDSLLKNSEMLVKALVADFEGSVGDEKIIKAVELAGRNRMLVKRMLNEACLTNVGVHRAKNLGALQLSAGVFGNALRELKVSSAASLNLANDVRQQLSFVSTLWAELQTDFGELDLNSRFDREFLTSLATQSDQLLQETDMIVNLFVNI